MSHLEQNGAQRVLGNPAVRPILIALAVIVGLPLLAISSCTGFVFLSAVADAVAPVALEGRYALDGSGGGVLLVKNLRDEPLKNVEVRLTWSSGIFTAESRHRVDEISGRGTATLPLNIRRVDEEKAPRVGDFYTQEEWVDMTRREQERELAKFARVQRRYEEKGREGRAVAFSSLPRITATASGRELKCEAKNDSVPLTSAAMIGMDADDAGRYAVSLADVSPDSAAAVLIRMDQKSRADRAQRKALDREQALIRTAERFRDEGITYGDDSLSILRSWSSRYPDQETIMERTLVQALESASAAYRERIHQQTGLRPTDEEYERHFARIATDVRDHWKRGVEMAVAGKPVHE